VLHQAAPGWYMAELRHEQGVEPERITLIVR
jgi:hypothetical protein